MKIIIGLILIFFELNVSAQIKISQLPNAIGNTDSLYIPVVEDGITKKIRSYLLKASNTITFTPTGDVTGSASGSILLTPVLTIGANKVTLAKQAQVATGTVFYRKSAATGNPEVQTLATLKTDLGLAGTNTGDAPTPTLQQVLSAGSTLLFSNSISTGTNPISFNGAFTGYALGQFYNSAGPALMGTASSATTSTVLPAVLAQRTTTGTAANGIGVSYDFNLQASNGVTPVSNQLISKWTNATYATRTSQFDIAGVNSASTETFANFQTAGIVRVNNLTDTLSTKAYARSVGGGGGGGGGISSLSAIGSTPNANAGTITGSILNFQPADTTFGGVVTTLAQSFKGDKTFTGRINGVNINLGTGNDFTTVPAVNSIVMGSNNYVAVDNLSIGNTNYSSGNISLIVGSANNNYYQGNIVTGYSNTASNYQNSVFGEGLRARNQNETALGQYNLDVAQGVINGTFVGTERIFSIGVGTNGANRKDAISVLKNGGVNIGGGTFDANSTVTVLTKSNTSYDGITMINPDGANMRIGGQGIVSAGAMQIGATSGAFYFRTEAAQPMYFATNANYRMTILETGEVGVGTAFYNPTATLDIKYTGTGRASLRIRSGAAPTTPNDGDIWNDGTHIYMYLGGVTKQLDN